MHPKKRLLYIGNKLAQHGIPPTTADSLPPLLREEGYAVMAASSKPNMFFRLWDMMSITYKNRKEIDLVIIDTYSTWNFYYAVIIGAICRHFKIPYIPVLHGGNLPSRLEKSKSLSRGLFNGAKTNVAPSAYLLDKFKEAGFSKLTYIPNTIPIENYTFLARPKISARLLWVRSFAEIYNPLLALQIVEMLLMKGVDVHLCMVGPEKDGALGRCKKVAEEMKLPITFAGLLSKEAWIALSKDYDIFINTTNFDNMPVSIMEAMALGMPVVSTSVGGLPYMIESGVNGVLVEPNNAAAFVDAIMDLIQNPVRATSMARNARTGIERMDWEVVKGEWGEALGG